ncbi:hypothetical protein [Streptomyces sp. NPDC018036]|uniref:hypothetical protein n=1 Tax=Streptomyces sp. NPDC018036 TaxID=3365035 RepID=UPI0037AC0D92
MNDDLLNAALGAAGALVVGLLTLWATERLTRRREARKQQADDRAQLQAQADELIAAVLALKVIGGVHDHLVGGWRARLTVGLHAAIRAGAGWARSAPDASRWLAGYGEAAEVIRQWDQASAASAAGLAAPLTRLTAAVAPLLSRPERALADAAEAVFSTVVQHFGDEDRVAQELAAFREALLPALDPPPAPRRRLSLRRHGTSSAAS